MQSITTQIKYLDIFWTHSKLNYLQIPCEMYFTQMAANLSYLQYLHWPVLYGCISDRPRTRLAGLGVGRGHAPRLLGNVQCKTELDEIGKSSSLMGSLIHPTLDEVNANSRQRLIRRVTHARGSCRYCDFTKLKSSGKGLSAMSRHNGNIVVISRYLETHSSSNVQ